MRPIQNALLIAAAPNEAVHEVLSTLPPHDRSKVLVRSGRADALCSDTGLERDRCIVFTSSRLDCTSREGRELAATLRDGHPDEVVAVVPEGWRAAAFANVLLFALSVAWPNVWRVWVAARRTDAVTGRRCTERERLLSSAGRVVLNWATGLLAGVALLTALVGPTSALQWAGNVTLAGIALGICAWRQCAARGEYAGDAAIHFQFARQIARGRLFDYDGGRYSSGSSSPLWTLMLGGVCRLVGEKRLETAAFLLSCLSAALAVLAAGGFAHALVPAAPWALGCLALAVSDALHVWTARSMETSLAAACVAGLGLAAAAQVPPVLLVLVASAALFVRWENALLLCPVIAWMTWARSWGVPLAVVPIAAMALVNWSATGTPLPSSARARRTYALSVASRRQRWLRLNLEPVAGLGWLRSAGFGLAAVGLAVATTGLATPRYLALAWAASLAFWGLVFGVLVPTSYEKRYVLPALPLVGAFASIGAGWALESVGAVWTPVVAAAVGLAAGWLALDTMRGAEAAGKRAQAADERERRFRRSVAEDLDSLLPTGSTLALIEVDILWCSRREGFRVLGIDGVLDAQWGPCLGQHRFLDRLRSAGATHLLVEGNLHSRPVWRESDLAPLVTEALPRTMLGDSSVACTRERTWPYQNWGEAGNWNWTLWRLDWQPACAVVAVERVAVA